MLNCADCKNFKTDTCTYCSLFSGNKCCTCFQGHAPCGYCENILFEDKEEDKNEKGRNN